MRLQVAEILSLLSRKEKRKYLLLAIFSSSLSLFDFLAMTTSGLSGIFAYSYFTSTSLPVFLQNFIASAGLDGFPIRTLLICTIALVFILFTLKSVLGLFLNYRNLLFLEQLSLRHSRIGVQNFLNSSFMETKHIQRESIGFALTDGIIQLFVNTLGNFLILTSESIFLTSTLVLLLIIDPFLTLILTFVIASMSYLVNKKVSTNILLAGNENVKFSIAGKVLMSHIKSLFREIKVAGSDELFMAKYEVNRASGTRAVVKMQILQQFPKYFLEFVTLVLGVFFLVFGNSDSGAAITIGKVSIYLAAISRLIPALLRLQSSVISIHSALGGASLTLSILAISKQSKPLTTSILEVEPKKILPAEGTIKISNLSFAFLKNGKPLLKDVSLVIPPKSMVALIGPSGAGKSTLADLIMGFIDEYDGIIEIEGIRSDLFRIHNPGEIGYIPQDVHMIEGTISENIALGIPPEEVDSLRMWQAVHDSMSADFINALPEKLATQVGENGNRFSGGQRQRIIIARALYSLPKFLILDEPTSALDQETEQQFLEILNRLKTRMTILIISHRRSSLALADAVYLLENGHIALTEKGQNLDAVVTSLSLNNEII
jgi:ABC-type multidrug transport system fused ATPase/permease subunit